MTTATIPATAEHRHCRPQAHTHTFRVLCMGSPVWEGSSEQEARDVLSRSTYYRLAVDTRCAGHLISTQQAPA